MKKRRRDTIQEFGARIKRSTRSRRPLFETLEARQMLAATQNGVLDFDGRSDLVLIDDSPTLRSESLTLESRINFVQPGWPSGDFEFNRRSTSQISSVGDESAGGRLPSHTRSE
jgi:hypothetical protein